MVGVLKRAIFDAVAGIDAVLVENARAGSKAALERLALSEQALGWIFSNVNKRSCLANPCLDGPNGSREQPACRSWVVPGACSKLTFSECCHLMEPSVEPQCLRDWVRGQLAQQGLAFEAYSQAKKSA